MSTSSAPYVDFQQFFVTRQNIDLVAMTGWRECVARVLGAKAAPPLSFTERTTREVPAAKHGVDAAFLRAPQNVRDRFPSQAVRRKTP